jgi:hypothetical protein
MLCLLDGRSQLPNLPVEGDDLLSQVSHVAAGRKVDEVPHLAAAPLDGCLDPALQPHGDGHHLGELPRLHERFERGRDALVHGVERLAPQGLVRHDVPPSASCVAVATPAMVPVTPGPMHGGTMDP